MEPDYKIRKVELFKNPLFILITNLHHSNLVAMYNYITSQKKQAFAIGQWIIKYKN